MKKEMKKLLSKMQVKKAGRYSTNTGFSLIELLIVIAIMGILAVIAFNMFGGVLINSKKRADSQQARNLEKAILTYCIDSSDWELTKGKIGAASIDKATDVGLIKSLLQEIKIENESYGPVLSPKYPEDESAASDRNVEAFLPQWSTDNGGSYEGWKIDIYPLKQSVTVVPTEKTDECKVTTH